MPRLNAPFLLFLFTGACGHAVPTPSEPQILDESDAAAASQSTPEGIEVAKTCESGRAVGETWKESCNSCQCHENGEVACTLIACTQSQ